MWALVLALLPSVGSFGYAAADSPPPMSATVNISDSGYSPASVSIAPYGSVAWVNQGGAVHTATSTQGPRQFDSGGLATGQSASVTLALPGTYTYSSAPDCLNNNHSALFDCGATFTVIVGGPTLTSPSTAPAPAASGKAVTVKVADGAFSPAAVTIPSGGTVTWSNSSNFIHSAISLVSAPLQFNTGGIPSSGGTASFTFFAPGTFNYTSGVDCLLPGGGTLSSFSCGVPYTVVVTGPVAPASAIAGTTITIDDQYGFSPLSVSVRAGQSVTWVNTGTNVHTVTSNPGVIPAFDSGGLGPGQSFSYTFSTPVLIGYHSATEPVYTNNFGQSPTIVSYKFNGTVSVSAG